MLKARSCETPGTLNSNPKIIGRRLRRRGRGGRARHGTPQPPDPLAARRHGSERPHQRLLLLHRIQVLSLPHLGWPTFRNLTLLCPNRVHGLFVSCHCRRSRPPPARVGPTQGQQKRSILTTKYPTPNTKHLTLNIKRSSVRWRGVLVRTDLDSMNPKPYTLNPKP